jgi:hypothetical protein
LQYKIHQVGQHTNEQHLIPYTNEGFMAYNITKDCCGPPSTSQSCSACRLHSLHLDAYCFWSHMDSILELLECRLDFFPNPTKTSQRPRHDLSLHSMYFHHGTRQRMLFFFFWHQVNVAWVSKDDLVPVLKEKYMIKHVCKAAFMFSTNPSTYRTRMTQFLLRWLWKILTAIYRFGRSSSH